MNQMEHHWRVGRIEFHLVHGDLFEVRAAALVNSEQTDFKLADYPGSISGQISLRFGDEVQPQLDRLTRGDNLTPGTVLRTTGGPYSAIFHAGFHHPGRWPGSGSQDDEQTEHLHVIRSCVRQILAAVRQSGLPSVAFPLLGAGLFRLDPSLVAQIFFHEVLQFAAEPAAGGERRSGQPLDVWLVILDDDLFHETVASGVQAWLDSVPWPPQWEPLALGIPYLDLFERQALTARSPQWASWMLVRYAELLTGYIFFHLACAGSPPTLPENIVQQGYPLTFGKVREQAMSLASRGAHAAGGWPGFLGGLMREAVSHQVVKRINEDRNAIAHGRQGRDGIRIREDIEAFVRPADWRAFAEKNGPPGQDDLAPWVVAPLAAEGPAEVGVFEQWLAGRRTYIAPCSGSHFAVPRGG